MQHRSIKPITLVIMQPRSSLTTFVLCKYKRPNQRWLKHAYFSVFEQNQITLIVKPLETFLLTGFIIKLGFYIRLLQLLKHLLMHESDSGS